MVTQKNITIKLKRYLKKVRDEVEIDKAFLVGSWAKGKASEESDVDLLVLSDTFKDMDMDQRLSLLYRKTVGMGLELHIHPVTRKELESASRLTSLGMIRMDKKISLI